MSGLTTAEQIALYRDKKELITSRPKWMSFEAYKEVQRLQRKIIKSHKRGTLIVTGKEQLILNKP